MLYAAVNNAQATPEYVIIVMDNDLSELTLNFRRITACHHSPQTGAHTWNVASSLKVVEWCSESFMTYVWGDIHLGTSPYRRREHHWPQNKHLQSKKEKKIQIGLHACVTWNVTIPKAFSGVGSNSTSRGTWNELLVLHEIANQSDSWRTSTILWASAPGPTPKHSEIRKSTQEPGTRVRL